MKKPGKPVDQDAIELGIRLNELADLVGGKKEMARLGGVSEVQIYRYINGENSPSIRAIARLAKAADVSVGWLITGEGERDAASVSGGEVERDAAMDRELLAYIVRAVDASEVLRAAPVDVRADAITDTFMEVVLKEEEQPVRLRMADAILATVARLLAGRS